MNADYKPYLKTLRRIPAPIIQSMATREIVPVDPNACLCGWALREALAFANGQGADDYWYRDAIRPGQLVEAGMAQLYGGTAREWMNIYGGICSSRAYPHIETAFARRVAECVR